jgi:hypothetical protein
MKSIAKSDLNFQGKALVPVSNITGTWLTSADLAKALNYKSSKSITNLFNQYSDEFSSGMSQVIESVTSGNYRKKVRVFSLRGAHLIAMFARTDVAKEFRRWVLDILDREVEQGNVNPIFNYGMDFFDKYRWIVGDKALSAPWFYSPEMLTINGDYPSPCGRLLDDMKNAGYPVEAAIFQLKALQHHLCLCLRKIDRVQQAVTH